MVSFLTIPSSHPMQCFVLRISHCLPLLLSQTLNYSGCTFTLCLQCPLICQNIRSLSMGILVLKAGHSGVGHRATAKYSSAMQTNLGTLCFSWCPTNPWPWGLFPASAVLKQPSHSITMHWLSLDSSEESHTPSVQPISGFEGTADVQSLSSEVAFPCITSGLALLKS